MLLDGRVSGIGLVVGLQVCCYSVGWFDLIHENDRRARLALGYCMMAFVSPFLES